MTDAESISITATYAVLCMLAFIFFLLYLIVQVTIFTVKTVYLTVKPWCVTMRTYFRNKFRSKYSDENT